MKKYAKIIDLHYDQIFTSLEDFAIHLNETQDAGLIYCDIEGIYQDLLDKDTLVVVDECGGYFLLNAENYVIEIKDTDDEFCNCEELKQTVEILQYNYVFCHAHGIRNYNIKPFKKCPYCGLTIKEEEKHE